MESSFRVMILLIWKAADPGRLPDEAQGLQTEVIVFCSGSMDIAVFKNIAIYPEAVHKLQFFLRKDGSGYISSISQRDAVPCKAYQKQQYHYVLYGVAVGETLWKKSDSNIEYYMY